jgi:excinuclease ABC subunit B
MMYADTVTDSMRGAIEETNRRRAKQQKYNEENGIEPRSIVKQIKDLTEEVAAAREEAARSEQRLVAEQRVAYNITGTMPAHEIEYLIEQLEKQMKAAAAELEFEKAALLRDQIIELRGQLQAIHDAEDTRPAWEKIR